MLYCGLTSRSLRLLWYSGAIQHCHHLLCLMSLLEIFLLPHCWPFLHFPISQRSAQSTSITTESRSSTALPAPYQYQTLQVVLLSCRIRPLASPGRPNRQLGAQRAHLPASTFTTIMAINYLGIMIGFPVLLAFALTNHPGHSILLREAGNAQHSHQGRDGDEPGS